MYGYNNPYYYQFPGQRFQPMEQQNQQPITQQYVQPQVVNKPAVLVGKSVDSIDVVKAMDIPLDGSICYFPIADGSAIVTKQLQTDGTSKTTIYKPTDEEKKNTPNYVTFEDLQKSIQEIDFTELDELKDEFKEIKRELKDLKSKLKNKGE